jgi:YVTN family beta-propeller protein
VVSPDGKFAYIASRAGPAPGIVTPIRIATGTTMAPITVGLKPDALAITPDGRTLYVLNQLSATVTPIRTATRTALSAIPVGDNPHVLVMAPDGKTVYVAGPSDSVVPIRTATSTAGKCSWTRSGTAGCC